MKFFWVSVKISIALILIGSLSSCAIEKIRSERLFKQYCNEEGRVGQFIYERVALSEEYFRPIPTEGKELRQIDVIYYLNSDGKRLLIDQNRFDQSYERIFWDKRMISPIGPIYSLETSIVRKLDGKVLSKAVSLLNMQGKTRKYVPIRGVYCPDAQDPQGYSLSIINHRNLIQKTFFKL